MMLPEENETVNKKEADVSLPSDADVLESPLFTPNAFIPLRTSSAETSPWNVSLTNSVGSLLGLISSSGPSASDDEVDPHPLRLLFKLFAAVDCFTSDILSTCKISVNYMSILARIQTIQKVQT